MSVYCVSVDLRSITTISHNISRWYQRQTQPDYIRLLFRSPRSQISLCSTQRIGFELCYWPPPIRIAERMRAIMARMAAIRSLTENKSKPSAYPRFTDDVLYNQVGIGPCTHEHDAGDDAGGVFLSLAQPKMIGHWYESIFTEMYMRLFFNQLSEVR